MTTKSLNSIEAFELFFQDNQFITLSVLGNKTERNIFIRETLALFRYITLSKKKKTWSFVT